MLDPDDETVIKDAADGNAVLVTWDRVVREAAKGITPYEALDMAKEKTHEAGNDQTQAELGRLRALSPAELTAMGEGADRTVELLRRNIQLDWHGADLVRQLRVEEDYSWRAIARWCSTVWGGPWGANQLAGLVICQKAAELLGQDFMAPPWN